jgi:tetratricopeptide (TPR) repeat protein
MIFNAVRKTGFLLLVLSTTLSTALQAAQERHEIIVKELSYGVSLYQFFQDRPLLAITELEVGRYRDLLARQLDDAELLKGGLYTHYGLVQDAERIFNDLLEKKTSQDTQNRIWFNLANIQYDRGNYASAADMFSRINGTLPQRNEDQKQYLLTKLNIMEGKFGVAARSSDLISDDSIWKAYTQYNMGIALKQNWSESKRWLLRNAKPVENDEELLSLADTSHLALGLFSLDKGDLNDAIAYTSRIRSSGPLSNKALLATGWAWSRKRDPDKAINLWQALVDKNEKDSATQEALLAIPYGYEQKGNQEFAALMYDKTAVQFNETLAAMDEVTADIQQGELLQALQREIQADGLSLYEKSQTLPRTSATPYLHEMFADNSFQKEILRYSELLGIQSSLQRWQKDLPTLDLMLKERRSAFRAKRPLIEKFSGLDRLKNLQRQRDELAKKVNTIERLRDLNALADEDETGYLQQLDEIKTTLDKLRGKQDVSEEQEQYRLISGILQYRLETEFPGRFWNIKRELQLLDNALDEARKSAESLQNASAQNEQILDGFEKRIADQFKSTQKLLDKVSGIISTQEQHINKLAVEAMQKRKQHVVQLRLNARYSQVRLYDLLLQKKDSE